MTVHLLQLLLGAKLVSVTALLLAAVNGTGGKASIALAAHLSLAVEGLGQSSQRGIIDTTTQTKHQMQGRLLLNIVIAKSASVL